LIDYESVSAAYSTVRELVKYCAPTSTIDIAFQATDGVVDVVMEMKSLQILPGEEEEIFEEGFSGAQARRYGLSGSGLGMPIVRQMLQLNGRDFSSSRHSN